MPQTQPLSHLHFSTFEIVFLTQPRLPLNFQLNFSRNKFLERTAQYSSGLPPHSHQRTGLKSFFNSILLKLLSTWFLAIETGMLQSFSNIHQN